MKSPSGWGLKIHNIVFSVPLNEPIGLDKLVAHLPGTEYEPDQFPGLIFRTRDPKAGMLVFSSGQVNIVGVKSRGEAEKALDQLIKALGEIGIEVKNRGRLAIKNIVASGKIAERINIDDLALNSHNTEYEPEQFPGLVYRMDKPKLVFLIFSTGRAVCVGGKNIKDVREGTEKLANELKKKNYGF